ncbi:MAG TPA: hypothetical protein VJP77_05860 [Planctomycetota bacterium]|nr:hypothetical protein [Planctomycetota bacterium]
MSRWRAATTALGPSIALALSGCSSLTRPLAPHLDRIAAAAEGAALKGGEAADKAGDTLDAAKLVLWLGALTLIVVGYILVHKLTEARRHGAHSSAKARGAAVAKAPGP